MDACQGTCLYLWAEPFQLQCGIWFFWWRVLEHYPWPCVSLVLGLSTVSTLRNKWALLHLFFDCFAVLLSLNHRRFFLTVRGSAHDTSSKTLLFFFSCIAGLVRDMVGQQLEKHVIEIKFPQKTEQATPTHKPRHGAGKSVREMCKLSETRWNNSKTLLIERKYNKLQNNETRKVHPSTNLFIQHKNQNISIFSLLAVRVRRRLPSHVCDTSPRLASTPTVPAPLLPFQNSAHWFATPRSRTAFSFLCRFLSFLLRLQQNCASKRKPRVLRLQCVCLSNWAYYQKISSCRLQLPCYLPTGPANKCSCSSVIFQLERESCKHPFQQLDRREKSQSASPLIASPPILSEKLQIFS